MCLWPQGHSVVATRKKTANRKVFYAAEARSGCSVLDQNPPFNRIEIVFIPKD